MRVCEVCGVVENAERFIGFHGGACGLRCDDCALEYGCACCDFSSMAAHVRAIINHVSLFEGYQIEEDIRGH